MDLGEGCVGCGERGAALCSGCGIGLVPATDAPVAGLDRVLAAFDYRGPVRDLILGLKLRHRRACALPLVEGLVDEVMKRGLLGSTITWVPGRRRDVLERGFDHAHVIAAGVGRRLGLPVRRCLLRVGAAVDQAGLGRAERSVNIAGTFAASRVTGELVLVDDLITTGATARDCTRALRIAGADGVEVLAAARA